MKLWGLYYIIPLIAQTHISDTFLLVIRRTHNLIIPVTRRVKGYTRFVGKYVTGRRKRFRPHKVYILLIRTPSRVDLASCPSVLLSVRPDER